MIILDFSAICYAAIFMAQKSSKGELNLDLSRLLVINSILAHKKKFSEYGKMIICCDSPNPWRKDVFPLYKKNRVRENPTDEQIQYDVNFYHIINTIRNEFIHEIPFPTILIDRLEADDIIAILAKEIDEKHIIISNDKDLKQLVSDKVHLYLAIKKELCFEKDDIINHILNGDKVDGIPNIMSDDDSILDINKSQKKLTKKLIEEAKENIVEFIEKYNIQNNYERNLKCIDLNYIPAHFTKEVMECLLKQQSKNTKIFSYVVKKKLKTLFERTMEFQ